MVIDRRWLLSKILILALFLASPLIESLILKRQDRYTFYGMVDHKFGYMEKKIYQDARPIDFLFLGPSGTWTSVNSRLIENKLREKFKREIIVQNFGHIYVGLDVDYIILRDVIEKRKIRNLFLGLPAIRQEEMHRAVRSLWDPFLHTEGMSRDVFFETYSDKILESFPSIIKKVREPYRTVVPFENFNGALILKKGYSEDEATIDHSAPFKEIDLPPLKLALKEFVVPEGETHQFAPFTSYQEYYLGKIVELCREKGVNLYFFVAPAIVPEEVQDRINRLSSDQDFGVPYFGLPMMRLFEGMDLSEVKQFFYNSRHTNANGANYFSLTILPALEEIYENQSN